MIFKSNYFLKDREGEKRISRKFALLPRHFKQQKTGKWLEYIYVKEKIMKVDVGGSMEWGKYAWEWVEYDFATEAEYLDFIKETPTNGNE